MATRTPHLTLTDAALQKLVKDLLPEMLETVKADKQWISATDHGEEFVDGGAFLLLGSLLHGEEQRLFPYDNEGASHAAVIIEAMRYLWQTNPDSVIEFSKLRGIKFENIVKLLDVPRADLIKAVLKRHLKIAQRQTDGQTLRA